MSDFKEAIERLARPFSLDQLKWRADGQPQNGMVYVIPYLDARNVMDRLDEALGMENWHTTFEMLLNGTSASCTIHVKHAGIESFSKTDVGSASNDTVGNPTRQDLVVKSAYSDALKRAAVHLGVGRYLYALSGVWVKDLRPLKYPTVLDLPDWALNEEDRAKAVKAREEAAKAPPVVTPVQPAAQPQQQPAKQPPQTQRLGGDGREQPPVQPPQQVEIVLPVTLTDNPPTHTHQELFVLLGPDDRTVVIPIANAIGAAAGQNSRYLLHRYYDAYRIRDNITQVGFDYLNAFLLEAWSRTSGPQYFQANGGA